MSRTLTNAYCFVRVAQWQRGDQPLVCSREVKHGAVVPRLSNGRLVLECATCKNTDTNIPNHVLGFEPEVK